MEWVSLELKLISCRGLKAFNFFHKLSVYAVVSISNDDFKGKNQQQQCLQRQKTPVDGEGGGKPEWNHMMHFDLKSISLPDQGDHLFLVFKLRCAGVIYGKRSIGEVRVPFKDLIDEFNGTIRFVSYQVRTSEGKPNGVLNFSYKVKGKAEKKGDASPTPRLVFPARTKIHLSPEKVHCPPLQAQVRSQDKCLYPSLDDIRSPLPEISGPSPQSYIMPPSPFPFQLPAFTVGHGPCPSPLVQIPGSHWYSTETASYGYGPHGAFREGWF
ncbi:hypothetical protein P3X46_008725 [Hevea brasiliensis]|uniref:C2 domain-containing protein n=1 Tax=Hevea brasiliensis TaxID=3981 RepID=A0ABQ9MM70_HEVBR|nr:protein SRC2 homolog [Hevea brasiliensis]KAJ9180493.1 hypothetical protein P3X46_008725 [Hevea brasiliensis]